MERKTHKENIGHVSGGVHKGEINKEEAKDVKEEDKTRLSPLSYKHVNMLGHYSFTLAEQVLNGQLRPLKQPSELGE